VEGPTEDSVGGGAEGDWEVEEPMGDPRPPGGREVQLGGAGLPRLYGCGGRVPSEEDTVSEVSEVELREWEKGQGAAAEEQGAGGELPLFPPTPRLTSWRPQERRRGRRALSLCFFLLSFSFVRCHLLCNFLSSFHIFLG